MGIFGENVTASPKIKFHYAESSWSGSSNTTLPHSKKFSDFAVSNSALQDFYDFLGGINYHGKINGCNFTKLTGMKSK